MPVFSLSPPTRKCRPAPFVGILLSASAAILPALSAFMA